MSRLRIRSHSGREFMMNVLQFRSPMSAAINSVQTHTMLQHFPIRCGQPDIQFTVKFATLEDRTTFQNFVRQHQQAALADSVNDVVLWWPERNIINWTGYISGFPVAIRRFDYAPVLTFGVDLVDSLMSAKTRMGSFGSDYTAVYGPQIPAYVAVPDSILTTPTPPSSSQSPSTSGPSSGPPQGVGGNPPDVQGSW